MSGKYNFTVKLASEKGHNVEIDTSALYGYWEYPSGVEGGGLWFERLNGDRLELVDFDGAYSLPQSITDKLRADGYTVGQEFDNDPPESSCSSCKASVTRVIGCPNGAELCRACFDARADLVG